jgi:hypothetical protein
VDEQTTVSIHDLIPYPHSNKENKAKMNVWGIFIVCFLGSKLGVAL